MSLLLEGLIKFVPKNYSQDFIESKLFMTPIESYRYEENEDPKVQDKYEGIVYNNSDVTKYIYLFRDPNSDKFHHLKNVTNFESIITSKRTKNTKVNCFTYFNDENLNYSDGSFSFKKEFIEEINQFQDERDIFICYDIINFIRTFIDKCEDMKSSAKADFINYYDRTHPIYNKILKQEDYDEEFDFSFYKLSSYNNQKEYRLAINDFEEDFLTYDSFEKYWSKINSFEEVQIQLI